MSDVAHGPLVMGRPAIDRLMQQITQERRRIDEPTPSLRQVAMVLHALADHTAIQAALIHRPDTTSPWPHATSMGRWFHDVGEQAERAAHGEPSGLRLPRLTGPCLGGTEHHRHRDGYCNTCGTPLDDPEEARGA